MRSLLAMSFLSPNQDYIVAPSSIHFSVTAYIDHETFLSIAG
jgi:hypothetical protein